MSYPHNPSQPPHSHPPHSPPPYSHPPHSPPPPHMAQDKPSSMAWAALLCGIGAWTVLPIVAALVGAVIGFIELRNIKGGKSPVAGRIHTQIGFWMSVVQLVMSVLGTCILVAFYMGLFALVFGAAAVGG